MSEKTYDGQTASFLAKVATCMPKNMSNDVMQGWIENPEALQKFLAGLCPEEKHLVSGTTIEMLGYPKTFNPHEYYRNRDSLYVWDGFTDNILSVAKKTQTSSSRKIIIYNLAKASNDAEIRTELPENHIWEDASEFCVHFSNMIKAQPNGKEGDLLSNGCANIFYVRGKGSEVFAVRLDWGAVVRRWFVYAFRLGVFRWIAGDRAFSCN